MEKEVDAAIRTLVGEARELLVSVRECMLAGEYEAATHPTRSVEQLVQSLVSLVERCHRHAQAESDIARRASHLAGEEATNG